MKKAFSIFIMLIVVMMASSCGKNETPVENKQTNAPVKEAETEASARISFDRSSKEDNSTYKEHVTALWEQTKPLLREDINKDYSDEEFKKLGAEIDAAWVNLQLHSSFDHSDERDSVKDAKFNNIVEDIMMLVDELYGNRGARPEENMDEIRANLKKSKLEYKINEFDQTIKNAR